MSDEKLNAAYSGLPREEPGAAIDAAILAASRRALAKPSASRRWAGPMSIAAVLVLAFGVTLHMEEEKSPAESPEMSGAPPAASSAPAAAAPLPPELKALDRAAEPAAPAPRASEAFAPSPPAKKKIAPAAKPDRNEARAFQDRDRAVRDEKPAIAEESQRKDLAPAPQAKLQAAPAPDELAKESNVRQAPAGTTSTLAASAPTPPPPRAAAAPAPAVGALRMKREAANVAAPASTVSDAQAIDEPTRELEAIAKLRAEGKHEEADKALAEFRRKRPGYRIAEAMWERVRPR